MRKPIVCHDVSHNGKLSSIPIMHQDLPLIIQIRISLIDIQTVLALLRDSPQDAMYLAPGFPCNSFQPVSGSITVKEKLIVLKNSGTHYISIRANPRHLLQVDVHAVGKV